MDNLSKHIEKLLKATYPPLAPPKRGIRGKHEAIMMPG